MRELQVLSNYIVPRWVTATLYKWWQRWDSGIWWRPVSGSVGMELWVWMWIHPGTDLVSSGDDSGCRHERRMSLLNRY
jgi:hypothetical protein